MRRGASVTERDGVHTMFKTTRGLILREVRYKEADRMLTVLTEDEGKLTVKARGALRARSRVAAATQLLTYSELTLFGARGRWTVNEGLPLEQFLGLRNDLSLLALGSYFAEALEAVSDEDCPDPAVLQLGLNSLYALSAGLCAPEQVKAAFELRLLCLSGYEPDLSVCAACGAEEPESGWFQIAPPRLLCGNCRRVGAFAVPAPVLAAMRRVVGAEPKRIFSFALDDDSLAAFGRICEACFLAQLDRPFGSLDYYKRIREQWK